MLRIARLAVVFALTFSVSGAALPFVDAECVEACASESESEKDPCGDEGVPCTSCIACPCAHRAPAVSLTIVEAAAAPVMDRAAEWQAVAPTAPPAGRLFQPPRA